MNFIKLKLFIYQNASALALPLLFIAIIQPTLLFLYLIIAFIHFLIFNPLGKKIIDWTDKRLFK